ncbi:MAG: Cof-type HAD-IIB family hydrolase [Treponema sp.]|jgi:Cof subfamily protein (haloacid dehalogenase superfamily)|nr:Cof-type HAD-IIB family hydrolase [Treponema sp.]
MNSIRLIALDLDNTLLRSDRSISFHTRNVIKRVEAEGIVVVLASGRIPAVADQFVQFLGMHKRPGYLICNNGTIIQESHTGNIVYDKKISPKAALVVYDLATAEGFPVQIYEDNIMYVSRSNEFADYAQKITGLRQVVVENFRDMIAAGCSRLLIPGDPMILQPLENLLRVYVDHDITLLTSRPYFLEILPTATDKGIALQKVAELLKINRESVLAIGDSMNDETMIRWAGVGVAMLNGDERIKNIASLITEYSNDDDGVADIITRYILGKKEFDPVSGGGNKESSYG